MMDLQRQQRASLLLQTSTSTVLATAALPSSLHLPSSHLSGNSFPTAATKPPLLGLARSSSTTTVNPASSASPAVRRHGACSKQLAPRRKLRGIRATKSGSADAPDSSASTSSSERGKLLLIATDLYSYQTDPRHMKDSWRKVLNSNAENSVEHSSHQNRDGVVLTRFWFLLWWQVHRRNNRTWNYWSAWRRRTLQLLLLVSKHRTQSLCPFSPFSLSDSQPVQNTTIAPLFFALSPSKDPSRVPNRLCSGSVFVSNPYKGSDAIEMDIDHAIPAIFSPLIVVLWRSSLFLQTDFIDMWSSMWVFFVQVRKWRLLESSCQARLSQRHKKWLSHWAVWRSWRFLWKNWQSLKNGTSGAKIT